MEFLAGLHPKIVHFPIALLMTYGFLEIIGAIFRNDTFSKAAYCVLILGVIGAVAAVLTGNQAGSAAELLSAKDAAIPLGAISEHETYANISLWFFAGILVIRTYFVVKKKFRGAVKFLFVVLALIGSYFILEAGLKGGELVFKHGVGTELINTDQSNNSK
jgi:uncharacterized membrane protein